MRSIVGLLIVMVFVLGAAVAWSADSPTLEERADAIERVAKEPDGDRVVVGHLSRSLKISVGTLREERARTGLGWGELLIAHRLATLTKRSLDDVVADFRAGKGWSDIAQAGQADFVRVIADVKRTQEVVEHRSEDQELRPEQRSLPPERATSSFPQLPIGIPGMGSAGSDAGSGRGGSVGPDRLR